MYRNHFEETGETQQWLYQYKNLNTTEKVFADKIIHTNRFSYNGSTPKVVAEIMKHYQVKYKGEGKGTPNLHNNVST